MLECPELAVLETEVNVRVRDHLALCASCRVVAELLDERRRGVAQRDRHDECARFEMLIAARDEGTIGGSAGALLETHLRDCADCRAVAATLPPASERSDGASLPLVSTAAYALGREVARGGMGRILEALDVRIGRPVAVKELLGKAPSLAARFDREARVTARLQHPGIVPIYEIGKWPDGTPFYTMRMVEGRTLREAIRQTATLDERLGLLPAIIAAADAVAFAHDKQILHRDLTPTNILVGAYGDTVVIDWGLAKDLSDAGADDVAAGPYRDEPTRDGLTSAGAVIGTAAYMPPEQARGEPVDPRADVYALGAILYHLLASEAPYRASKSADVLAQLQAAPPRSIREVAPGAPRDLVSIVDKAMSRDAANRYASAGELAAELRRFQTGRVVEAHRYSRRERIRRWVRVHRAGVLAGVASAVVLAIVGSVGLAGVLGERDRAELGERAAIEQRAAADAARTKAQRENAALMEEQGRQELLAGNTTRALAWLNEAYKAGDDSAAIRFMLGTTLRQVESIERMLECGGQVGSIELSPDQTKLMASCEGSIKIWRLSDGALVATLAGATQGATYSHDGHRIASHQAGAVSVWDVATGALVFTRRDGVRIRSVAFTLDDRTLITTGDDANVRAADAATGAVQHVLPAGSGDMNVVRGELTRDGHTFISTNGHEIVAWDVATWTKRLVIAMPSQPVYDAVGSSPDGSRYVACGTDGTVRVWDLATGREVAALTAHAHASFSCTFSDDGRHVVSTGLDGIAKVWDVDGRKLVATLPHGGLMLRGQFSPDGQRVATIGGDGVLKIWHTASASLIASFDDPFGLQSSQLVFSRDGHRIVTVRDPHTLLIFKDLGAGPEPRRLPDGTSVASVSPTGAYLALRDAAGAVSIVDATTLARIGHEAMREPVAWSEDGARVAAAAAGGGVVAIETRTGATLAQIATDRPPDHLELDPTGHRLLVSGAPPKVWDVDHRRVELALDGRTAAAGLSHTGGLVVAWVDPKRVEVWSLDRRAVQATIALDADVLDVIGYDADAAHVALTAHEAGAIGDLAFISQLGIYDVRTGARVASDGGRLITTMDASHRWLASSGLGGKLDIRDARDGTLVSAIAPGPAFMIAGRVHRDGGLVMVADGTSVGIRDVAGGRLLGAMRPIVANVVFTQDSFRAGDGDADLTSDGRMLAIYGPSPVLWNLPREQRSPAEVDRIVRANVRWRVVDGSLQPLEATIRGRVMRGGHPVAGADVALSFETVAYSFHVATDADGRFALGPIRTATYTLVATHGDARGVRVVPLGADDVVTDIELDDKAP